MDAIPSYAAARKAAHFFLTPLFACALGTWATAAPAAGYSIVDLGTLSQGASTVVRGPNIAGTAVGGGRLTVPGQSVRRPEGLLFERSGPRPVPTQPGTDQPQVLGVNDMDTFVGAANTAAAVRAFLGTRAGISRELGPLPGDNASVAYAINNAGLAVGYSSGASGQMAVSWALDGQPTALPVPGGRQAVAYAINQRGDAVGVAGNATARRPVVWPAREAARDLAVLPGFTSGEAAWLNDRGDVVGYSATNSELRHATVWPAGGAAVDIGTLRGGSASQAFGINDSGLVVGSSESSAGSRAFLWTRADGMRDLNGLARSTHLVLTKAVGINNRGMIVALGYELDHAGTGDHHDHERPMRVLLLIPGA